MVGGSSGVSLKYFGPLQPSPLPEETVREFVSGFRCIPSLTPAVARAFRGM